MEKTKRLGGTHFNLGTSPTETQYYIPIKLANFIPGLPGYFSTGLFIIDGYFVID